MQCQETTAVAEEEEKGGALMEKKLKKKTLLFLPHELIIQILMRLPVKSLLRFKCVCKLWFSLISNPHFANSHFQLSSATPTRRILLMSSLLPRESRSIDLEAASSLDDYTASVSLNPNFMPFQSYSHIEVKCSCRGFILLHCYSQMMLNIYLWNPSTGFHKKIPLSPFVQHYHDFYGFGYDQSKDDYLLVSLSYHHLEIFSLRANAWEEIVATARLPFGRDDSSAAARPVVELLFNGSIHWMARCRDIYVIHTVIVAFHLTERKLLEIPLPVDINYNSSQCDLWVFKGFLSLWVSGYNTTVDIWVMKEYQVHSSWSKTLVLTNDFFHYISPICCTKRGDIIGKGGGTGTEREFHLSLYTAPLEHNPYSHTARGLVKYNDKGELLDHNPYDHTARGFHLTMYTESLLSLPSDIEQA
ncbi:F-box/kelch-repeat protein [Trifolium pratense]|uniref:F-box/kelch-repeat protein n=1 Tax=Trifolium pratense TaxID=57577 RepID=A0A2K3NI88_TRIPR|nr:F-box/kelch-repeat protein At3g23880-like [Trifolium pratense]PNY02765.1 F-box/kelch-repeat protein [Trifolium pratense]